MDSLQWIHLTICAIKLLVSNKKWGHSLNDSLVPVNFKGPRFLHITKEIVEVYSRWIQTYIEVDLH